MKRACEREKQIIEESFIDLIAEYSNGDARIALNHLEKLFSKKDLSIEQFKLQLI